MLSEKPVSLSWQKQEQNPSYSNARDKNKLKTIQYNGNPPPPVSDQGFRMFVCMCSVV